MPRPLEPVGQGAKLALGVSFFLQNSALLVFGANRIAKALGDDGAF